MRIGFDARLIKQTGVGRYILNLLDEFKSLNNGDEFYIFMRPEDERLFKISNSNWHKIPVNLKWHSIKEQLIMPFILNKYRLDIMHFPYFNVPFLYRGKYIITIHDLIIDHFTTGRASTMPAFLYFIKRLFYHLLMKRSINKSAKILTISQTTKNEVMDHYATDGKKISVTFDSLDKEFSELIKKYKPKKSYDFKYFLYVGNAYPHKNLEKLCLCFSDSRIHSRFKLVLAGDDWFFYPRLIEFCKKNSLQNHIVFAGNADNKKLIDLYSHARALIIPSLMEGFGLPNLEAVSLGVFPIVSDIPVFKELWQDELFYFDPSNTEDIKNTILDFIKLPDEKVKIKIEKAKTKLKKYSWHMSATETYEQYRQVVLK